MKTKMTKDLPRIISDISSIDWMGHLFKEFTLSHQNTPKYEFYQGEYYHTCNIKPYDFKVYKGKDVSITVSKYFKFFSMTIGTEATYIFDRIKEFCSNETFTHEESFNIIGSREKSYYYIGDHHLSSARIAKMTDNYARIVISHTTIDKTPKQNIEFDMSIKGELKFYQSKKTYIAKGYSDYSEAELKEINKWKNVKLKERLAHISTRIDKWRENLYECSVNESEKRIRIIYVNSEQKDEIQNTINVNKSTNILIEGKFKMYTDYTAILTKLTKLKNISH
jgi:hypothetical protein